jgi:hypothetical protein
VTALSGLVGFGSHCLSTNQIRLLQIFALLLQIFALLLQIFALLLQIFALLLGINCTQINQSQSRIISLYIIMLVKATIIPCLGIDLLLPKDEDVDVMLLSVCLFSIEY